MTDQWLKKITALVWILNLNSFRLVSRLDKGGQTYDFANEKVPYQNIGLLRCIPPTHVARYYSYNILPTLQFDEALETQKTIMVQRRRHQLPSLTSDEPQEPKDSGAKYGKLLPYRWLFLMNWNEHSQPENVSKE